MSQEPKKRHSRARQGKRRAAIKLSITRAMICKNCGAGHVSHAVCAKCGYYKGESVLKVASAKRA